MFDHYTTLCMKGLNLEDPQSAQNEYLRSRRYALSFHLHKDRLTTFAPISNKSARKIPIRINKIDAGIKFKLF